MNETCATCPAHHTGNLVKLGVDMEKFDYVVALAGNPNVGKSTVFNSLTGLRQHTGNWPGKTVTRAEGAFALGDDRFKLVDLPGTYSLLATSVDEEIARNFILFGRPDVTVIVVDANHLERNLNLTLQVLEITDRAVVCLNLVDEASRRGRSVDTRVLAKKLGVPVVATVARRGEGIAELIETVAAVARGEISGRRRKVGVQVEGFERAVSDLESKIRSAFPTLSNARWTAVRLLDGDRGIAESLANGELATLTEADNGAASDGGDSAAVRRAEWGDREKVEAITVFARELRWKVGGGFQDALVENIYTDAAVIVGACVTDLSSKRRFDPDRIIDDIITSRVFGFPLMLGMLMVVFWVTIAGANVPSRLLSRLLLDTVHPALHSLGDSIQLPWWASGFLFDGVYLSAAWVISVMLPPMAIFFPLFTFLEDAGYLARVSFNLDGLFRRAGAHGKQALTMSMGFGCNAAGVVATRIIDSRRERMIAIITNNFALCNGRWPTQILMATVFVGALVPAHLAGLASATAVVGVAALGVALTFVVSFSLSRTSLKGEPSSFSLELPPYRPPRFWRTLYTSLVDRTVFVLWRAVVFAVPAGAIIWLVANIHVGDGTLAEVLVGLLDPLGVVLGLSGIILLSYIVAIPANEIVIPTLLMLTVVLGGVSGVGQGAGVMFELESAADTANILHAAGWTTLMGVNLMLFSLIHNPCSTTIYTIWTETRSVRWTAVATFLPLAMGFVICFLVAQIWRLVAG